MTTIAGRWQPFGPQWSNSVVVPSCCTSFRKTARYTAGNGGGRRHRRRGRGRRYLHCRERRQARLFAAGRGETGYPGRTRQGAEVRLWVCCPAQRGCQQNPRLRAIRARRCPAYHGGGEQPRRLRRWLCLRGPGIDRGGSARADATIPVGSGSGVDPRGEDCRGHRASGRHVMCGISPAEAASRGNLFDAGWPSTLQVTREQHEPASVRQAGVRQAQKHGQQMGDSRATGFSGATCPATPPRVG